MSVIAYERVHENLKELQLDTIDEILDTYLESAIKERKPALEILDYLLTEEQKTRRNKRCQKALRLSGIPYNKTFEDFDFKFQPSIDLEVVNDLKTLRFIHNAENIVFLGPPGVGKTHLAISLGLEAIYAGMRVHFINASLLIERLLRSYRKGSLGKYISRLTNYDLLIIDEIGYRPFDADAAHCFFQLICSRYENRSTVLTSNKSYSKWGEIFQDQIIATAFLDRLLHHCTTVNIKGDSYRMKDALKKKLVKPSDFEE